MQSPPPLAAAGELNPRRWLMLAILLLAAFMNLIDVTIVNVALPALQQGLGATESQLEWIVAAYVLAFAIGLIPFGRLGDRVGRRAMFLLGVGGFTLFSALCGLAPSAGWLIAARAAQGFAGAMMMPQVLAITQVSFPPQERGFAFSLFGLTAGLASVAGPLGGGLLIGADLFGLDWRPIFLVNIPIGILAILAGRAIVPVMKGDPTVKNDGIGTTIAGVSIFLLVFALIEGRGFGWPSWIFGLVALAFAGAAAFYLYEKRLAARGFTQLIPATLLGNGNFLLGIAMTTLFFSGVAGFFLVFAIFLQSGFGFTPLQSGLTTLPFPLGILLVSLLNGRIGSRWLRQRLAIGALVLLAAMTWLRSVVGGVGDAVDHWQLAAPLFVAGLGMGLAISSLFQTVLTGIPPRDAGSGSGSLQAFQQIGSALGVAIMGQIFFSILSARLTGGAAPHPSFVDGLAGALTYQMAVFALVAVLVFFLKTPTSAQYADAPVRPPVPIEV